MAVVTVRPLLGENQTTCSIGLLPCETDRYQRRHFVLRLLAEPAGLQDAPATLRTYRGWWLERTGHAQAAEDGCRSCLPASRTQDPHLVSGQAPLREPDLDLLPLLGRERAYRHDELRSFPRFLRREPRTSGDGNAADKDCRRLETGLERIARLAAARVAPNARAIDTARLPPSAILGAR